MCEGNSYERILKGPLVHLQTVLHCIRLPTYISPRTSLVVAIFICVVVLILLNMNTVHVLWKWKKICVSKPSEEVIAHENPDWYFTVEIRSSSYWLSGTEQCLTEFKIFLFQEKAKKASPPSKKAAQSKATGKQTNLMSFFKRK